jgi:hypothetical protein
MSPMTQMEERIEFGESATKTAKIAVQPLAATKENPTTNGHE